MKNKIFNKNDLTFYYQAFPFPKKLISEDALIHKDYILLEEGEEPVLATQSNKRFKHSVCFVIEEELEKTKPHHKNPNRNMKGPNQIQSKNQFRKYEKEENSSGFFDEFKGKTDEKQITQLKRNLANSENKVVSISIIKSVLSDHFSNDRNDHNKLRISDTVNNMEKAINGSNDKEAKETSISEKVTNNVKTTTISADNFFENSDKILLKNMTFTNIPNHIEKMVESNQGKDKSNPISTPDHNEEFNIKDIYRVNDFLKYPKDEPLWYIFHPTAKSSFGPITSVNIEEMFNGKMLVEKSEIRFIDVYNFRNSKPFSFFALKEISSSRFLKEIDISSLLGVAVNISSKERDVSIQLQENKVPNVTCESSSNFTNTNKGHDTNLTQSKANNVYINNPENSSMTEKRSENILNQPKTKNNDPDGIYSSESIYNISSNFHSQFNQQGNRDHGNLAQDKMETRGAKKYRNKTGDINGRTGKINQFNI